MSGDLPSVAQGKMGLRDLDTALLLKPLPASHGREDVAQTLDITHGGRFFTLGVPGTVGGFMRRGRGVLSPGFGNGESTEATGALGPALSHAPHGAARQWGASGGAKHRTGQPGLEHTRRPLLP